MIDDNSLSVQNNQDIFKKEFVYNLLQHKMPWRKINNILPFSFSKKIDKTTDGNVFLGDDSSFYYGYFSFSSDSDVGDYSGKLMLDVSTSSDNEVNEDVFYFNSKYENQTSPLLLANFVNNVVGSTAPTGNYLIHFVGFQIQFEDLGSLSVVSTPSFPLEDVGHVRFDYDTTGVVDVFHFTLGGINSDDNLTNEEGHQVLMNVVDVYKSISVFPIFPIDGDGVDLSGVFGIYFNLVVDGVDLSGIYKFFGGDNPVLNFSGFSSFYLKAVFVSRLRCYVFNNFTDSTSFVFGFSSVSNDDSEKHDSVSVSVLAGSDGSFVIGWADLVSPFIISDFVGDVHVKFVHGETVVLDSDVTLDGVNNYVLDNVSLDLDKPFYVYISPVSSSVQAVYLKNLSSFSLDYVFGDDGYSLSRSLDGGDVYNFFYDYLDVLNHGSSSVFTFGFPVDVSFYFQDVLQGSLESVSTFDLSNLSFSSVDEIVFTKLYYSPSIDDMSSLAYFGGSGNVHLNVQVLSDGVVVFSGEIGNTDLSYCNLTGNQTAIRLFSATSGLKVDVYDSNSMFKDTFYWNGNDTVVIYTPEYEDGYRFEIREV